LHRSAVLSLRYRQTNPPARRYGEIIAGRLSVGKPISSFDALIAAIALAAGARMVTRNIRDFEGCGLTLIDPWTA